MRRWRRGSGYNPLTRQYLPSWASFIDAVSSTTANLSAEDQCSGFFPSAGTANPSNLACLRQLYSVTSEMPVSLASRGIGILCGGIIFWITDSFLSAE